MQYDPKLKKAMAEIVQVLEKYDIAASIVLSSPNFCEHFMRVDPSYSCASLDGPKLQFKGRKIHYPDEKVREEKINKTVNMFAILAEGTARHADALLDISEKIDEIFEAQHKMDSDTNPEQQNN